MNRTKSPKFTLLPVTKRTPYSTAYIDSTLVVAFLAGLVAFAVWIAWQTAGVINPWWLGGSIIAVGIYQMLIFWVMQQYWEADRILGIFTTNIVCLGLILGLVGVVFGIRLPVDLPILNFTLYLAGIEATSFSPGAVALSYGFIGLIVGIVVALIVATFENSRFIKHLKQLLRLDRLDLRIDLLLDRYSFWMENYSKTAWIVTPTVLLIIVTVLVVGSAALI
ncbi:MAG: hypothetical protein WAR37_02925 [Candidatus Microsaccharimonas sp.]